jgi:hypothetical protein
LVLKLWHTVVGLSFCPFYCFTVENKGLFNVFELP